jgi:hypothetical protein
VKACSGALAASGPPILDALTDPNLFAHCFQPAGHWRAWRVFLAAGFPSPKMTWLSTSSTQGAPRPLRARPERRGWSSGDGAGRSRIGPTNVLVSAPAFQASPAGAPPDAPLLGPRDIAARWGVPVSWVYAQAEAGKLPAYKVGKYLRF